MKKFALTLIGFVVFAYVGFSAHAVTQLGIEHLLLCADKGGLKVPFSKQLCRNYLMNFRGSQEDIATLQQGVGAFLVTQGSSPISERTELLEFLVGKGLDVNRAGMDNILPLHGAVLANSADGLQILLDVGANPFLTEETFGLTPWQLALRLKGEDTQPIDRSAVFEIFRKVGCHSS